jgi:hypothetical protein
MSDRAFPQRLISAAPDERFAYFHNWRVVHPKLVQAKDELLQAIRYAGDRRLIHLVGCTGVGKTTLRKWVEYLLLEEHRTEMTEDPDRLPIASVVTPAPDHPDDAHPGRAQIADNQERPATDSVHGRGQTGDCADLTAARIAAGPDRVSSHAARTGSLLR